MYVSMYLSFYLSIYRSIYVYIHIYIYIYIHIYICIYVNVHVLYIYIQRGADPIWAIAFQYITVILGSFVIMNLFLAVLTGTKITKEFNPIALQ